MEKRSYRVAIMALACLLIAGPAVADLNNGGFEMGLEGWTVDVCPPPPPYGPGTGTVTTPDTVPGLAGNPSLGWSSKEGNKFAYLSTGGPSSHVIIWQEFNASAGHVLEFDVFFDTASKCTLGASDWAFARITGPESVMLYEKHVCEVGDEGYDDWTHVTHNISDTGLWTLEFHVHACGDVPGSVESALGVDNVKITPFPVPGAVLLGAIGLGLVGWVKKRCDKKQILTPDALTPLSADGAQMIQGEL